MPPEIPENVKKRIIKRHQELVDELNSVIDNKSDRINDDQDIDGDLYLPRIRECYEIAHQMDAMKQTQNQILDNYVSKTPLHDSDDRKWLICSIKAENTPEAKAYNDKLYKEYQSNPDMLKATLFRKALTFNPQKLMDCYDKNVDLLKLYKEEHEAIDLADVLANSTGAPFYEGLNEEFVQGIEQMSETLNVIATPKHLALEALTDDFYAMPEVNKKQANAVVLGADKNNKDFSKYVRDTLESTAGNDLTTKPRAYFKYLSERHYDVDSNFLTTYVARQSNNIVMETADFSDVMEDPNNYEVYRRSSNESFAMRTVNKEYQAAYQKAWMLSFNRNNDIKDNVPLNETLGKHKGGFFEKMFNTTSKEYREFEKALQDYNNPNSPNYLNERNLRRKGNAYLGTKTKNGVLDWDNLSGTSKKRVGLVERTLGVLDMNHIIEESVDREYNETLNIKVKQSFLKEEDLSDVSIDSNMNKSLDNNKIINNNNIEIDVREDGINL